MNDFMELSNKEEITIENVSKLSEEEVYNLLNTVIRNIPREKRSHYMNIVKTVYDFRSISPTKSYLKKDMMVYGYKFFSIPDNNELIMGIKRKGVVN
jgi:hypothetical protein